MVWATTSSANCYISYIIKLSIAGDGNYISCPASSGIDIYYGRVRGSVVVWVNSFGKIIGEINAIHHATDSEAAVLVDVVVTWADAGAVEAQVPRVGGRVDSRGPVVAEGTLAEEAIEPVAGENAGPSTRKLPACIGIAICRTSS